ncbi:hypothetical protein [Maribellus sp. YY47]|uniref:hypothetical protein n=1 Tax=Maribellus sp. YY47 TaxID=2929486 RepID=UPI0020013642|nr:hypothetical protein [Maribellus sp. YY47]MCK3684943.1 hypothetical protein [Maribellus sp. YY47]
MENKFKEGEVVRAKVNPNQNLIVRRYVDRIYYCMIQEKPGHKDLVYFERELFPLDPKNIGFLASLNVIINK